MSLRVARRRKIGWSYPCFECGENFPIDHPCRKFCSEECKEKNIVDRKKKYHLDNQEKINRATLAYYHDHKEQYALIRHANYIRNKEKTLQRMKNYYQKRKLLGA